MPLLHHQVLRAEMELKIASKQYKEEGLPVIPVGKLITPRVPAVQCECGSQSVRSTCTMSVPHLEPVLDTCCRFPHPHWETRQ